ncbi:hypothetical protein KXD40_002668 [Peronospora effusa]|nr:hypothetical protein KXD40_002668 [Peronospora effusa]
MLLGHRVVVLANTILKQLSELSKRSIIAFLHSGIQLVIQAEINALRASEISKTKVLVCQHDL